VAELADEMLSLTTSQDDGRPAYQPVAISGLLSQLGRQLAGEGDPPRFVASIPVELPLVSADPRWIVNVLKILVATLGGDPAEERTVLIGARGEHDRVVVSARTDGSPEASPLGHSDCVSSRRWYGSGKSRVEGQGRRSDDPARSLDLHVPGGSSIARPGLVFCRQLVEAHGGDIWVDEFPTGSRISFSLPRYWAEGAPVGFAGRSPLMDAAKL